MNQAEFERLREGDEIEVRFTPDSDAIRAKVANVDLCAGYINVDCPNGHRALVSRRNVVSRD